MNKNKKPCYVENEGRNKAGSPAILLKNAEPTIKTKSGIILR